MATLTQYPGSIAAGNPVDGGVQQTYGAAAGVIFSTIRGAAGNGTRTGSASDWIQLISSDNTGSPPPQHFVFLVRSVWSFDLTSLSGATVTAGGNTLSLFGTSKDNTLGTPQLDIVKVATAATNALANADFAVANFTMTDLGHVTYANWSTTAYNDITLNATGDTDITNKLGSILQLAGVDEMDLANSYTGGNTLNANMGMQGYFAAQTGTTNDPKLVVTYTPAATTSTSSSTSTTSTSSSTSTSTTSTSTSSSTSTSTSSSTSTTKTTSSTSTSTTSTSSSTSTTSTSTSTSSSSSTSTTTTLAHPFIIDEGEEFTVNTSSFIVDDGTKD